MRKSKELYSEKMCFRDRDGLKWCRATLIDYAPPPNSEGRSVVVLHISVDDGDMQEFYSKRHLLPNQTPAASIRYAIAEFDRVVAWVRQDVVQLEQSAPAEVDGH